MLSRMTPRQACRLQGRSSSVIWMFKLCVTIIGVMVATVEAGENSIDFIDPDDGNATVHLVENSITPDDVIYHVNVSQGRVLYEMNDTYLEMDSENGTVSLKDGVVLDYEAFLPSGILSATFNVTQILEDDNRRAEKKKPKTGNGTINVVIYDVNEPPSFDADPRVPLGFRVMNNSKPRTYIGRIRALDPDTADDNMTVNAYQIGTAGTPFTISNAGTLRLQTDKTVDSNITRVWTVVIEAVDKGVVRKTGSTTIYISVCDVCKSGDVRLRSNTLVTMATGLLFLYSLASK